MFYIVEAGNIIKNRGNEGEKSVPGALKHGSNPKQLQIWLGGGGGGKQLRQFQECQCIGI